MIKEFTSEIAASKELLSETTALLIRENVGFVVVGGWAAYLFHSTKYGHPGTFDVDILLHPNSLVDGSFEKASEAMLSSNYLRAPKNKFQAHKLFNISGEEMVFHVDFLDEKNRGEEVDVVWGNGKLMSVYTDSMRAVFKYEGYRTNCEFPGVRFPSPETFIVTKAAAVNVKKRERDAFDIFITAIDQPISFSERWKELTCSDGLFNDANGQLLEAVNNGDAVKKVLSVLEKLHESGVYTGALPTSDQVANALCSFLVK